MGDHKSYDELREMLKITSDKVIVGGTYVHYKNVKSRYTVDDLVISESDDTISVIYHASADKTVKFVRPISSWLEVIDDVSRFSEVS